MAGPIRDDSAGEYGQWINPDDWSWLDSIKAAGSDTGNALSNLGRNVLDGISPFAPTATQYGKPSLQVPPMAQGLADSFSRLAGTPSQPGNAYDLTGVREIDAPIQSDMSNVMLSVYGGNAVSGLAKAPQGSVGMFAGRKAATADHAALAKAEGLASQGVPREQIWNETGWFQGPDQKWRFEIDDSKAYLDDWGSGVEAKLGKVFDHRPAFEAYPSLSNIDVTASRGQGGSFNPDTNSMQVDWSPNRTSTALHETQHAAQGYEGFSPGSSPDSITNMGQLSELRNKLTPDQLSEWSGLSMEDRKMLAYRAQAGEVEARTVQARQNLTPEQRASRPPWLDYDVPESQQIVRLLSDTGNPSLLGSALATAGEQLPMDHASRMARARDMGFDTDKTWYHGTNEPRESILPGVRDPGAWFTTDLQNAANYARGDNAVVYDTYLKSRNPFVVNFSHDEFGVPYALHNGERLDIGNNVDIVKHAQSNGYDSVHFPDGNYSESGDTKVVFSPSQIRSRNAAFDPSKSDAANLMSAKVGGVPTYQDDTPPWLQDILNRY
jgi:hypothetical protein